MKNCALCENFERCRAEHRLVVWTESQDIVKDAHATLRLGELCPIREVKNDG